MATIRYLDAQGSTLPLDLVGDSGMLPLSTLMASLANPSSIYSDDGTRIRQSIYSGTTLRFRYEYSYASVLTPNVEKNFVKVAGRSLIAVAEYSQPRQRTGVLSTVKTRSELILATGLNRVDKKNHIH